MEPIRKHTGLACCACHLAFRAAASIYPSGRLFLSSTLREENQSISVWRLSWVSSRYVREIALVCKLNCALDGFVGWERKRGGKLEILMATM